MILALTVAAAALLSGLELLVIVIAVRALFQTRAHLRAARAELVACAAHLAAADTEEHRLRLLVDAQIQLRAADFETFRADLQDLRGKYEHTIAQYRLTLGRGATDPARSRRRVH
jgi:hypothetical protein